MITIEVDARMFAENNDLLLNILIGIFTYVRKLPATEISSSERDNINSICYTIFCDIQFLNKFNIDVDFTNHYDKDSYSLNYLSDASELRSHLLKLKSLISLYIGQFQINLINCTGRGEERLDKHTCEIFKINKLL